MNIDLTLFGIAYIIGLIIPGVFFKRFYYQGHFAKQFRSGLFADRLLTNIFWGIVVQTVTFLIFSSTLHIDRNAIVLNVVKSTNNLSNNGVLDINWDGIFIIQLYFMLSIAVAIGLGMFLHHLVRWMQFDVKFSIFRFSNKWHYRFNGEFAGISKLKVGKGLKFYNVWVDLYLNNPSGNCTVIKGIVVDYDLDQCGDLRYVLLDGAKKYDKNASVEEPIKGHRFLVKMAEIKDVNFRYVYLPIDPTVRKRKFAKSIVIALMLVLVGFVIFPWFLDMTVRHKIISVICGIFIWAGIAGLTLNPFLQKPERTSKRGVLSLTFMTIGFLILLILTIRIESFRVWIYHYFW